MSADLLRELRDDFPALRGDPSLIYLDSAATSLKPQCVIDEVVWFLGEGTSAVFRGVHQRAVEATERFEDARGTVARWFNVANDQVVLTRGTTDGINLVRRGLRGLQRVLTTNAEHHSNLLPWREGLDCQVLSCDSSGRILPAALDDALRQHPAQLVALSHVGNVFGTIQPVTELSEVAHAHSALLLVDAAQSASHLPVGLDQLGADYLVCSGHKMLGPSGIGALVGQPEALDRLQPISWGGSMVEAVDDEGYQLQPAPRRWEAGTPAVESLLGWAAALEYLELLGREAVHRHLEFVTSHAIEQLQKLPGVEILGALDPTERSGILPLRIEGWESHTAARVLSQRANLCLRSGFHCAEPLHKALGLLPTLRASFHVYTTPREVDQLVEALDRLANLRIG